MLDVKLLMNEVIFYQLITTIISKHYNNAY